MPFLSFIEPTFAWNVPLVSLIFLKRSLIFPILLFSSTSLHWSLRKAFYLSLLFFGTLHSHGYIFPFPIIFCFSKEHYRILKHFRHVPNFAIPWTVALQAPLSMGFPRQEYWSGLPFPPPGDLPNPAIKPTCPLGPILQADSLPLSYWRNSYICIYIHIHTCIYT